MTILSKIKTALLNLAATAWGLLPSVASGAEAYNNRMARCHAVTKGGWPVRPAGSKLARKAAKGLVGVARIR